MLASAAAVQASPLQFEQKFWASETTAGDWFGESLAASETTLVVGATSVYDFHLAPTGAHVGAAYLYELQADGRWQQQVTLTPPTPSQGDNFGLSVAVSNDTVVVSAPFEGVGAVYLYEREQAWQSPIRLSGGDYNGSVFGVSVAIDGDLLVVGDSFRQQAQVFERNVQGVWRHVTTLEAPEDEPTGFGSRVAIRGATAVVGGPFAISDGAKTGAAYVFQQDAAGNWGSPQRLAPTEAAVTGFGSSLSANSNQLVIGSSHGAYIYGADELGSWTPVDVLSPGNLAAGNGFANVAASGDLIAIGNISENIFDHQSGGVFLYEKQPLNSWRLVDSAAPTDPDDNDFQDWFGRSVAFSGQHLLVAAWQDDEADRNAGAVYAYRVVPEPSAIALLALTASWLPAVWGRRRGRR